MPVFAGIQRKIVLPFSAMLIAVFAVTAVVAARVVMRQQEAAVRKQAVDMARFINAARLPLSRGLMERIKAVSGKEAAFYDASTGGVTATLEGGYSSRLAELPQGVESITVEKTAYRVFGSQVSDDGSRLYLFMPESDLDEASRAAASPIIIIALAGASAAVVLGIVLARTITGPLRRLAAEAESTAREDAPSPSPDSAGDEVANLADAFQRMLKRLDESRRKLIEAEKLAAVGRVATGIAHEVRNPLASMKMNAQLLQEALPGNDVAAGIVAEIERVQSLVEQLLYYGRPTPLRAQEASVNAALDDALAVLAPQLAHAHVELVREYDAALPAVKLDRSRFRQAVMNLAINAMDAMPGGGRLTVRTRNDGSRNVIVEFDDTGTGIPDGLDAKIFEPFFSTREGGIGIGLAVCKRIIEEHGGSIEFSRKDKGTVFRVRLPIA